MNSYIIAKLTGNRQQLDLINSLSLPSKYHRRALLSLINSTVVQMSLYHGEVPFPYETYNRELGINVFDLYDLGYIKDFTDYSITQHKCRRFIVDPELVRKYVELGLKEYTSGTKVVCEYDLISGKRQNIKVLSVAKNTEVKELTEKQNNSKTAIIRKAKNSIQYCIVNKIEMLKTLSKLKAPLLQIEDKDSKQYKSAYGKYINEAYKVQKLFENVIAVKGDYMKCKVVHTSECKTGRIFASSGLQGMSREMKAAALKGVKYHNYDLKSSQLNLFINLLNKLNYDTEELLQFSKKENQYKLAEELKITIDEFKKILYGLLFGANHSKVTSSIYEELAVTEEYKRDLVKSITIHFQPLLDAIKYVKTLFHSRHTLNLMFEYSRNSNINLYNHCGKRYEYNVEEKNTNQRDSELLCFYLQGIESRIIHELTVKCAENGITVYSNEHDGLITNKEIPQELIDNVFQSLAVEEMELVEKVFKEEEYNNITEEEVILVVEDLGLNCLINLYFKGLKKEWEIDEENKDSS
jgi:hypothetical protein